MTLADCEKQMDEIKGTLAESEKQMDEIKERGTQLCKKKKVLEAITIVKELNKKFLEDETKKQPLLDDASDSAIFLQVTMKKIPPKKMFKRIRVRLPHSLVTDTTEVCLITGDMDKRNKKAEIDPDVLHYKELLKKEGITKVNEVITLRQLRTEYKVYEARRQLMAAYDVFLADKKIAQCLPRLLGKSFFKKRKFPIQINMNTSNLKNQVDKALSETVFSVTCHGNSCASEVARLGMDNDQILENVLASVKIIADQLPGEQDNIYGIYMKTARSQAIPIFISFGNPNEVKVKKPFYREKAKLEELSTLPNARVKVFRDGRILVKKTRDTEDGTNGVKESKPHHNKRKRDSDKDLNEDLEVEDEISVKSEESEPVVEDVEEDTSRKKSKKKRKLNEKNKAHESVESEVTEFINEELEPVIEDIEEDTSRSKSKKKRKLNEKNNAHESVESEVTEFISEESEPVIEDIEEDTSRSKSKKKRKLNEKNNAQEFVESEVTESKPVVEDVEDTSRSKSKKKHKLNEKNKTQESVESEVKQSKPVIEDVEEDTSRSKSKKKHKLNEKNKTQESEESEVTEFIVENVEKNTSMSKSKSRRKNKAVIKIEAAQDSPKVKSSENGLKKGQKKVKS